MEIGFKQFHYTVLVCQNVTLFSLTATAGVVTGCVIMVRIPKQISGFCLHFACKQSVGPNQNATELMLGPLYLVAGAWPSSCIYISFQDIEEVCKSSLTRFLLWKLTRKCQGVSIATGYLPGGRGVGVRATTRTKLFSSSRRPDRFWAQPSVLPNEYRELLPHW